MIDARQIMAVVISLMLLVIGIFVVGIIATTTTTGTNAVLDTTYDGTFTVTDPTVDQTCNTGELGLTGIVVTQFDGVSWTAVPAANVSYTGTTVTVQSGGLVGGS